MTSGRGAASRRRVLTVALLTATLCPLAACQQGGDVRASWSTPPSPAADSALAPSASASASASPPTSPPAATLIPAAVQYVFPVSGTASYARVHHDYPASDIMAACGLPVRAVTSGVVAEVSRVDRFDRSAPRGEDKGGLFVSLIGDDGVRYYGAHLSALADGIGPGVRVAAGARLGLVGSTGNSGACHLHFGISPPCQRTADWWTRRGVVWPWQYLDAWRSGQSKSPAAEVTAWQQTAGCAQGPP